MSPLHVDVCVVGGGPAGSTAAVTLARLGHRVCVVESRPFPRPRPGESLTTPTLELLRTAGLSDHLRRVPIVWTRESMVHWGLAGADRDGGHSAQVDRGEFDAALLRAATLAGCSVLQPAYAEPPIRRGAGWEVRVRTRSGPTAVSASFLVIATGRRHLLPGQRLRCLPPMLAVHARWTPCTPWFRTVVKAMPEGWLWAAPQPNGQVNAILFVDAGSPPADGTTGRLGLRARYLAACSSSGLADLLRPTSVPDVQACDASAYVERTVADEAYIRIGDAALTADPLSSHGVHCAIVSGVQGAAVVNTVLGAGSSEAALQFWRNRAHDMATSLARQAAQRYADGADRFPLAPFWSQREHTLAAPIKSAAHAAQRQPLPPGVRVKLSPQVTRHRIPALVGSVVRWTDAISHPETEARLAFVGNAAAGDLADVLSDWTTLADARRGVSDGDDARGAQVLLWLWERGFLVSSLPGEMEGIADGGG